MQRRPAIRSIPYHNKFEHPFRKTLTLLLNLFDTLQNLLINSGTNSFYLTNFAPRFYYSHPVQPGHHSQTHRTPHLYEVTLVSLLPPHSRMFRAMHHQRYHHSYFKLPFHIQTCTTALTHYFSFYQNDSVISHSHFHIILKT